MIQFSTSSFTRTAVLFSSTIALLKHYRPLFNLSLYHEFTIAKHYLRFSLGQREESCSALLGLTSPIIYKVNSASLGFIRGESWIFVLVLTFES